MTDLEKMIVCGCTIDKCRREEGYQGKSVIPWGLVGVCVCLDIFNMAIDSAKKVPYEQAKRYRGKHF